MQQEKKGQVREYAAGAVGMFKDVRALVGCGLLVAVGIVLKVYTLPLTVTLRVGFSFVAIAMAAYLYGPVMGGMVGVLIDILGFLLNPTGPYFFGFTLNAFLNGFICGLWLWRQPVRLWRVAGAAATCVLVVNIFINPFWLRLMYGGTYLALLVSRIPTNAVALPLYIAAMYMLMRVTEKQKRYLVRG